MRRYPLGRTVDRQTDFVKWEHLPLASCTTCGYSWVTKVPDELDRYYAEEYSHDMGRGRKAVPPEEYFADETHMTRPDRSHRHVDLVTKHTDPLEPRPGHRTRVRHDPVLLPEHHRKARRSSRMKPCGRYLRHAGATVVDRDDIAPNSLDAVVSSHQLEHVRPDEILDFLRWIKNILRPGGTLLVEVPLAVVERYVHTLLRHDPHLSFFSIEALDKMITRAGFEVVHLRHSGKKRNQLVDHPLYTPSPENPEYANPRGGPIVVAHPVKSIPDSRLAGQLTQAAQTAGLAAHPASTEVVGFGADDVQVVHPQRSLSGSGGRLYS